MEQIKTEIIVVGAGISGLLVSCILALEGFRVSIIEKQDMKKYFENKKDGRMLAISHDNFQTLSKYNLISGLKTPPSPIEQIRIADEHSPFFLHFDNKIINNEIMGYMIDAFDLQLNLYKTATNLPNIQILDNQNLENIYIPEDNKQNITLQTQNHNIVGTLLIAADGKNSQIREFFDINTYGWKYNQTAIICNIEHELNHQNIAIELFLPNGPFAVLPLYGGHKSAIVWTEKEEMAPIFTSLKNEDFLKEVDKRLDSYLGKISLAGSIFTYNLSAKMSKKYYHNRVALIGDSAHFIHPIAGQGLNLGIRDISSLTELLIRYRKTSLDFGSQALLLTYHNSRIVDNTAMLAFTDLCNRIFSNKTFPLRQLRKIGLKILNQFPKIQRSMMLHAMGKINNTKSIF